MNPDEPLRTKNLAEEDPAPMDDTLGGYPWLPRMTDKARASAAGTLGGYFKYPCPIDRHCLSLLGVDPVAFKALACDASSGGALLGLLARFGAAEPRAAQFDPVELNRRLHSPS